ncbi:PhzF family phenazine biosynthesis protein [Streptacidiphilus rugosus]|uniref:PhzF family phenazine biosynthesis protein n=1 Tax=Streptacidiphilus rugosus TaxID=405783 RepID=UPI00055EFEE7|nr:PhzF family phenazine biosynthesis isomerase [Streptacidiphilus rugosus]
MRIRVIDAFTDVPFAGNPAAVCLLPAGPWPDGAWMRGLAAEMNLSETAFARPLENGRWALRWLTPAVEVDLCGHATLATTHALLSDGLVPDGGQLVFESNSGILRAEVAPDGMITLDFPVNLPTPAVAPAGLAAALGTGDWKDVRATGALGDLVVELADEAAVRELVPDHTRLAAMGAAVARGVVVTAPAAAPEESGYDFVSRWFGVGVDVGEDPVTGSAHTALAPLWAERLGRKELTGRQVSPRGGSVRVGLRGDRVLLSGRAVTVWDGTLTAAAAPPSR